MNNHILDTRIRIDASLALALACTHTHVRCLHLNILILLMTIKCRLVELIVVAVRVLSHGVAERARRRWSALATVSSIPGCSTAHTLNQLADECMGGYTYRWQG